MKQRLGAIRAAQSISMRCAPSNADVQGKRVPTCRLSASLLRLRGGQRSYRCRYAGIQLAAGRFEEGRAEAHAARIDIPPAKADQIADTPVCFEQFLSDLCDWRSAFDILLLMPCKVGSAAFSGKRRAEVGSSARATIRRTDCIALLTALRYQGSRRQALPCLRRR